MPEGQCKWFSGELGYGFLEQPGGPDVFVHHSAILMDGYRVLEQGERVAFDVATREGRVQAESVIRLDS